MQAAHDRFPVLSIACPVLTEHGPLRTGRRLLWKGGALFDGMFEHGCPLYGYLTVPVSYTHLTLPTICSV
eukprot:877371-Rhodomonas_salina.4